ncbi:hypothetical protein [Lichenicola cladoniae]|nr:hypothetical protein [Lichenicola cladoniae]
MIQLSPSTSGAACNAFGGTRYAPGAFLPASQSSTIERNLP